jgi:CAAX prenyl protease-like protein
MIDSTISTNPNDGNGPAMPEGTWSHAAPFLAWLVLMPMLDWSPGWVYALRSVLCAGLFIFFRPWSWYPRLKVRNLPLALVVGVLVSWVWVLPESRWMAEHAPHLQCLYLRIGTLWPWALPEPVTQTPYAPEVCGWPLSLMRLLGSAVVIAVIEEFFWRGFLYRRLVKPNFLDVDLGTFHAASFLIMGLLFGLEHQRWLVGVLAGLAYGWMVIHTRDIWAVAVAHGITNFLLGLFVLATRAWGFW